MTTKIKQSIGEKVSGFVASLVRSWTFVIFQLVFILIWVFVNLCFPEYRFDKYPFDLLKLLLTIEASFVGSLVLMAQNKRAEQDRQLLVSNYIIGLQINKKLKKVLEKDEK